MRTVALILLGCLVLSGALLTTLLALLGLRRGLLLGIVLAAVIGGVYISVIGPPHLRWGATVNEVHAPMPGDDLLRPDAPSTTRAITIDASA